MKKKLLMAVSYVLILALGIAGTVAYFTDRDAEVNVFTVGDVQIELNNEFKQGAELMPGKTIENEVTITNTGKNDAWVWLVVSVGEKLDGLLKFGTLGTDWEKNADGAFLQKVKLAPGETTPVAFSSIAFDSSVDATPDGVLYQVVNGDVTNLNWNIKTDAYPTIKVAAYAIQAESFANVEDAYAAYGLQWGDKGGADAVAPVLVDNAEDLAAAIAAGNNVALTEDIDLSVNGKALTVDTGKKVTLNLNGNDIIGTTTSSGASQVLFEVKGELTVIGDGTIALYDKSGAGFDWRYENAPIYVSGGVANLNGGSIVCISDGGAMAYAADAVSSNSVININGSTLYSSYIAVRSFVTVDGKTNTINYNSGIVYGAKKGYDIWVQEDSVGTTFVNIADGINYRETDEFGAMYYIDDASTVVATPATLSTALQNGGTVTLATDVFVDKKLAIAAGKEVVLDLNGNELSGAFTQAGVSALIQNQGTLTVKNGKVTSLATNPDTDWNPEGFPTYASNTISNSGVLVVEDGALIENQTNVGGASYAIDNYAGATLTVNGGEIKAKDVAIRINTASTSAANNVTINGGVITGKRAIWIHIAGSNSAQAPVVNLEITGGDFNSTSDLTIYSYSYGQSFENVNVKISGGDFEKDVAFGGGYKGDQENVTITGGTFHGELGRYLANDGWEDIA